MEITFYQLSVPLAGAITAIGGAYLTIKKIQKEARFEREHESAKILQDAKEEIALVKTSLHAKIEVLKNDIRSLEASVEKDINHIKQTYSGEIRNLGEKIEELRSELRNQHGQLVSLLSEMIKKRDY